MHVEWLETFVEVTKQGSLSKASKSLNLTQPAVSKQIRQLEESFGTTVFRRSASGVELTEDGAYLLEQIDPLLSGIHVLRENFRCRAGAKRIRIAAIASIAHYYLPSCVISFRQQGIEYDTQLVRASMEGFQLLQNGEVDAAMTGQKLSSNGVWSAALFSEDYVAVVPSTHALASAVSVHIKDIALFPHVLYPIGCDSRTLISSIYAERGFDLRVSYEVPFTESLLGFVAAGAGVTILPAMTVRQVQQVAVRVVPIADFGHRRTIYLHAVSRILGKRLYGIMKHHVPE